MIRKINIPIGTNFSRLTVLKEVEGKHGTCYLCICICGQKTKVYGSHLLLKKTKSCGCLRGINRIRIKIKKQFNDPIIPGQAGFNSLYLNYIKEAKRRNYDFLLTKEEFGVLTKKNCSYCGKEPEQKSLNPGGNGAYFYNGVDRIENTQGYTIENCTSCCGTCNMMKKCLSVSEFKKHIEKIYKYVNKDIFIDRHYSN